MQLYQNRPKYTATTKGTPAKSGIFGVYSFNVLSKMGV